jgi:hypothetical protein
VTVLGQLTLRIVLDSHICVTDLLFLDDSVSAAFLDAAARAPANLRQL